MGIKIKTRKKFRELLKRYKRNEWVDRDVYLWTDEQALIIFEYGIEKGKKKEFGGTK
jgi:hypothetical protein